jgi:hypothetical protein
LLSSFVVVLPRIVIVAIAILIALFVLPVFVGRVIVSASTSTHLLSLLLFELLVLRTDALHFVRKQLAEMLVRVLVLHSLNEVKKDLFTPFHLHFKVLHLG